MTQQLLSRRITGDAFSREAVLGLSERNGEPAWLRGLRLAAWEAADRLPFPTGYERAWKYLKPDRLRIEGLRLSDAGPSRSPAERDHHSNLVHLRNHEALREDLADDTRAQGVTFCSLSTAVRERPDLVQRALGSLVPAEESVFTALNAALWEGGVLVHVPRDTKVHLPLGAMLTLHGEGIALFPRVLVVVERGAEVTVAIEQVGGEGAAFVSGVVELVLADEAKLRFHTVQQWGGGVQELFFQRAEVGRNAELVAAVAATGGSIYKGWIEAQIGAGARSEVIGALLGAGSQYLDLITLQDHVGEHSTSDLLVKNALTDRAQAAYYGVTRVEQTARLADANQENRNLLLSDKAKAEADPVLEILTSEVVRCGHGASAGPVDQEQLFYLECRGLPRPEAERLLVQGFLGEAIGRMPLESVRTTVEKAIAAKLG